MSIALWQNLFEQIEIVESSAEEYEIDPAEFEYEVMSMKECEHIERELDITFPRAYKEFCQIFGTGLFGDEFIEIRCPSNIWLKSYHPTKLDLFRSSVAHLPKTVFINKQEIMSLVDSAFIFGGYEEIIVFWDTRTYQEEDDSHDIYWALDEPLNGEIFRVGRNFIKFVQDCCLGDALLRYLPSTMHELIDQITFTFQRYPRLPQKYWYPSTERGSLI